MILEATTSVGPEPGTPQANSAAPDVQETNPWLSAEARFNEAAQRLGLDEGMQKVLRSPASELRWGARLPPGLAPRL